MNNNVGENEGNCSWVPHERTGIYYPKGHEKVFDDVPPIDFEVNWFFQKLMGNIRALYCLKAKSYCKKRKKN